MYVVSVIMALFYLMLAWMSRKEDIDTETEAVLRPFYRMALYLYKWVCILKLPFFRGRQVSEDLARIHPGESRENVCMNYYVGKLAKSLLICFAGTFLALVVSIQTQGKRKLNDEGYVTRGDYETGAKELEIACSLPEGKEERFRVQVNPRVFNEEEAELQYENFVQVLPELIRQTNVSLEEVSADLELSEFYSGYPFKVMWESSDPTLVRSDGTVSPPEKGAQEMLLTARISYEEWEKEESIAIRVVAKVLSPEEHRRRELEKLLIASEQEGRMEEEWYLPSSWQGEELKWRERVEDRGVLLWVGAVVVSVAIYLLADHDLHDELEKRKQRMLREYPDIVHKLALYLGAGMTIRSAFHKIAGNQGNPIYEEMLFVCRELQTGVSEGVAYEHFGKRTGIQEYIRLSTLLTQNLKKGSSTLLSRLREEAEKSSQDRLQYGKRLGEEAVTKLLLPMIMMLLVVMLMIMIPAFSSVGG